VSGAGADPLERAEAARSFLRAHRRSLRPSAYQVYVTLLFGAITGAFARGALASLIAGGVSVHGVLVLGPGVMVIALLAAARFGTWQGPVSFSAADVGLLLTAPIASEALVRPKLDRALVLGAAVGAVAGALVILVLAGGPAALGVARSLAAVIGIASLSASCVALSWLVQSSRRSSRQIRRASPAVVMGAACLVAAGALVSRWIGVWSGPWGWSIAALAGGPAWPVGLGLALLSCAALVAWARGRAHVVSIEAFAVRAGTRSALAASAFTLDYRAAALAHRAALPAGGARLVRIRPAARPERAIAWRDALALARDPWRVGWATLLAAGATLEALSHPGLLPAAGLAAAGLYFAAGMLCEPLRVDVDHPDRSAVLLSWPFARVLLGHCALPALVLFTGAAGAIVASVVIGMAGAGALALIPSLLVPVVATAVLAAALASRRGGRVDEDLMIRMLSADPSSPAGVMIVFWLIPWLIATLIVVGGAATVLGHAVAHHRPILDAGAVALAITAAASVALLGAARRTKMRGE
jgi:hypothetical protein